MVEAAEERCRSRVAEAAVVEGAQEVHEKLPRTRARAAEAEQGERLSTAAVEEEVECLRDQGVAVPAASWSAEEEAAQLQLGSSEATVEEEREALSLNRWLAEGEEAVPARGSVLEEEGLAGR